MLLDLLIVLGALAALYRGTKIGFVRQSCSTAGFFLGLLIGAWIGPRLVSHVQGIDARAMLTVTITLGSALIMLTLGEYIGLQLKYRALPKRLHATDNGAGGLLSAVSLMLGVWLVVAIISGAGTPNLQAAVRDSRTITQLNRLLPPAPGVVAKLSHLIDPNGFPDVFIGNEPVPRSNVNLPALGDLASAVNADKDSVVRIQGQGCGGIVSGSGFVVRPGIVATNAHVVAGIQQPYVQDTGGSHAAEVIWFDPDLDFALLKAGGLNEHDLSFASKLAVHGTPAAVLGYPGGGAFSAKPAVVIDDIQASGRNIYGTGHTTRDVYEVQADVVPGNSGGPVIGKDGKVIGIVFAESVSYDHVGYALTADHLDQTISGATAADRQVGTGRCAE